LKRRVLHVAAAFTPAGNAEFSSAIKTVRTKLCLRQRELTVTNPERAVLETKAREIDARNGASVANAVSTFPSNTSREIDLLEQSKLAHELHSFIVGICPSIWVTAGPGRRILGRRVRIIEVLANGKTCQCRND
jgi:hypothetical protein